MRGRKEKIKENISNNIHKKYQSDPKNNKNHSPQ